MEVELFIPGLGGVIGNSGGPRRAGAGKRKTAIHRHRSGHVGQRQQRDLERYEQYRLGCRAIEPGSQWPTTLLSLVWRRAARGHWHTWRTQQWGGRASLFL